MPAIRRSVIAEHALGLAVLALTATLGGLDPSG
jgi:putative copper export protein